MGVTTHALVCAKKNWADGDALRARKEEKIRKIPRKSRKIGAPHRGSTAGGGRSFEFFSIYFIRDLEIYITNPPEICVGVSLDTLVCTKKYGTNWTRL